MVLLCIKISDFSFSFFQPWNQAHLTKNRLLRAILGLQISTDYKGAQHISNNYMFFLQASIMNTKICDICIQNLFLLCLEEVENVLI